MNRKRLSLLLLTLTGLGVGIGGATMQPPQWQTRAELVKPNVSNLGNYFSLFSTYHLVSGDPEAVNVAKMEQRAINLAYDELKKQVKSPEVLTAFLNTTEQVKNQVAFEQLTAQQAVENLEKQFQFTQGDTLAIQFTAQDARTSRQLFGDYVQHLNAQTRQQLNRELITKWKILFDQIKGAADAKLDVTWENKLKLMNSVQRLDNNLAAFQFTANPTTEMQPKPYLLWGIIGALLGALLGWIIVKLLTHKTDEQVEEQGEEQDNRVDFIDGLAR